MRPYDLPDVSIVGVCHDCRRRHEYRVPIRLLDAVTAEWQVKHAGHTIEFSRPRPLYTSRLCAWIEECWAALPWTRPTWAAYGHNADAKVAYASSAAYTITLTSLATSSTRVAGRESTAVSNASNKYLDYLIGGKITTGTSPTASKQIDVWVYAAYNDTPTYPTNITGSDAAATMSSENQRNGAMVPASTLLVDSTSDRTYPVAPFSLTACFGGIVPTHHGLWVAHDTAVNLNSTGSNQALSATPVYGTVA